MDKHDKRFRDQMATLTEHYDNVVLIASFPSGRNQRIMFNTTDALWAVGAMENYMGILSGSPFTERTDNE